MNEKRVNLSPPWITFYNEVKALFKHDPDVEVKYDDDTYTIIILVNNQEKAEALEKLIPSSKEYGNVTLRIKVVPANMKAKKTEDLFRKAFDGNAAVKDIIVIEDVYSFNAGYVVFAGEVVQFFNDELGDINGMKTMLYQDIAKDVFSDIDGMFFFCTETI